MVEEDSKADLVELSEIDVAKSHSLDPNALQIGKSAKKRANSSRRHRESNEMGADMMAMKMEITKLSNLINPLSCITDLAANFSERGSDFETERS
jgi:hypothetical protein